MTQVNKAKSTGVPSANARATTVRLSETELYGTAAMTREPFAARDHVHAQQGGMSNGVPFSTWPARSAAAAAACCLARRGTSRSAPGDTSVMWPAGSSTCTVISGATGMGSGQPVGVDERDDVGGRLPGGVVK